MSALSDYAKFDKLDVSDDEEEGAAAGNVPDSHYVTRYGETAKFDHYDGIKFTAADNIAKTPLSELPADPNEMSSEDDSDEDVLPLFSEKIGKKTAQTEFVKSLQAITDEATPLDMLESWKDQGNDHYKKYVSLSKDKDALSDPKKKEKLLYHQKEAIKFYTDAVLVDIGDDVDAAQDTVQKNLAREFLNEETGQMMVEEGETVTMTEAEVRVKWRKVKGQVLTNRAMVHFVRGNLRKCLRDCKAARRLDPTNIKCYFHGTKAYNALKRYEEGSAFIETGLEVLENVTDLDAAKKKATLKSFAKLKAQATLGMETERALRKKEKAAAKKQRVKIQALQEACNFRGVRMGPPIFEYGAQQRGAEPVLRIKDPADLTTSQLTWPLLILYEETSQTDFIQEVHEGTTLRQQLEVVLPDPGRGPPIPWDREGTYTISNIEVWIQVHQVPAFDGTQPWPLQPKPLTRKQALVGSATVQWANVPLDTYLGDLVSSPQYVVPQVPVVHILPKGTKFYRKKLGEIELVPFIP